MNLTNVTYQGPAYEVDETIEPLLPDNLQALLKQINGFIQFEGGLHVRGLCSAPDWHSLRGVLKGERAIHTLFAAVEESDIPFAQDCMADQFLLRDQKVCKLFSETGELQNLETDLETFLANASRDPVEILGMEPLLQLKNQDQRLQPGQVIHAYPPFCTEEAANGVSLKPVSAMDALFYLSDLSKSLDSVKEGEKFKIQITE